MNKSIENMLFEISLWMRLLKEKNDIETNSIAKKIITENELLLLEVISKYNKLTISELNDKFGVIKLSAISLMTKKLEKEKGLIVKQRDTKDDRVVVVSLTNKGKQLLDAIKSRQSARFALILDSIQSEQEKKAITEVLERSIEKICEKLGFPKL